MVLEVRKGGITFWEQGRVNNWEAAGMLKKCQ